MTTNVNAVNILNRLVQINMDRKEGYRQAGDSTDDRSLQPLFEQYAQQSGENMADLKLAIESYGGVPNENTTVSGDVYRGWMDIKNALSTNLKKSLLESCERGEDAALATYKDILEDNQEVDNNMLGTITVQKRDIEIAHDHIKSLRDNA